MATTTLNFITGTHKDRAKHALAGQGAQDPQYVFDYWPSRDSGDEKTALEMKSLCWRWKDIEDSQIFQMARRWQAALNALYHTVKCQGSSRRFQGS
ncbi:hypothetical protein COLO4_04713 [Corchorus olitorius]|uniref:Uncharacterized protein n=1 Tax=Corchorus olitorius TaxID=93759 RepID=A0A1R3KSY6_9ROSI|nr:hypothetical protein COLO4_04713 [Corchorus olitorius]